MITNSISAGQAGQTVVCFAPAPRPNRHAGGPLSCCYFRWATHPADHGPGCEEAIASLPGAFQPPKTTAGESVNE